MKAPRKLLIDRKISGEDKRPAAQYGLSVQDRKKLLKQTMVAVGHGARPRCGQPRIFLDGRGKRGEMVERRAERVCVCERRRGNKTRLWLSQSGGGGGGGCGGSRHTRTHTPSRSPPSALSGPAQRQE